MPIARPFRPSIMLKAWLMPADTRMVNKTDTTRYDVTISSPGIPNRGIQQLNNRPAHNAEAKDKTSRMRVLTSSPISSPKPPKKTGKDETPNKIAICVVSCPAKSNTPTIHPNRMLNPPTLGVGLLCDDCRAEVVWPLAVNRICKGFVSKMRAEAARADKKVYKIMEFWNNNR